MRQGGREERSVLVFPRPPRVLLPVAHRLGSVEEDVGLEVRLLLVLLDVEAVGAAEDLPVDVAGVVARDVLPVLGELHAEAVVGALVEPRDVPLDDHAGLHLETAQLGDRLRVEVAAQPLGVPLAGRRCGLW